MCFDSPSSTNNYFFHCITRIVRLFTIHDLFIRSKTNVLKAFSLNAVKEVEVCYYDIILTLVYSFYPQISVQAYVDNLAPPITQLDITLRASVS